MTFQQLRYLLEVHKTGSISKAAENLFVSRPSVSLSISSLEAELGYPVFIRSQSGLIPSPQGQLVIKYANDICQTHELIKSVNTKKQSLVRISVAKFPPANKAILRLLDEYKERNDVTFSITGNTGLSAKDVALANLDIVLSAKINISRQNSDEQISRWNLYSEEIAQLPMGICIGPGHRNYKKADLCPADFKNDPYLDTVKHAWSSTGMLKNILGAEPKNLISLYNNPDLKNEILYSGLAYTIRRMPKHGTFDNYGLRYIPLEGIFQRLIYVIDPNRQQHEAVTRFLEILKEELNK